MNNRQGSEDRRRRQPSLEFQTQNVQQTLVNQPTWHTGVVHLDEVGGCCLPNALWVPHRRLDGRTRANRTILLLLTPVKDVHGREGALGGSVGAEIAPWDGLPTVPSHRTLDVDDLPGLTLEGEELH